MNKQKSQFRHGYREMRKLVEDLRLAGYYGRSPEEDRENRRSKIESLKRPDAIFDLIVEYMGNARRPLLMLSIPPLGAVGGCTLGALCYSPGLACIGFAAGLSSPLWMTLANAAYKLAMKREEGRIHATAELKRYQLKEGKNNERLEERINGSFWL